MFFRLLSLAVLGLLFTAPGATSAPLSTTKVLSGTGTLYRGPYRYSLKQGSKLIQGDVIKSGFIQLSGDYDAWTGTSKNTIIITRQRRVGCGIEAVITYTGPFSIFSRPFTCPTSRVSVVSAESGGVWHINSALQLIDSDKKTTALVLAGCVEAEGAGKKRVIPAGYGAITKQNKAPSAPIKIDYNMGLSYTVVKKTNTGIVLTGRINPLNTLVGGGQPIPVTSLGKFTITIPYQKVNNHFKFEVKNPLLEHQRIYTIPPLYRR